MTDLVERVAQTVWDAPEPLSGDPVGVLIVQSDHLFPAPEHELGKSTSESYRLAGIDVCRTIARAVIPIVLEEAAKLCDDFEPDDSGDPGEYGGGLYSGGRTAADHLATAIRALAGEGA